MITKSGCAEMNIHFIFYALIIGCIIGEEALNLLTSYTLPYLVRSFLAPIRVITFLKVFG